MNDQDTGGLFGLGEEGGDNLPDAPNVDEADYDTKGRTTVATRPGHSFQPNNTELPIITPQGVKMTKDEAEAVVEEARTTRAGVHIVTNTDEEGE